MERVIIFAAGLAMGGIGGYFYAKSKFQAEKEEEIESMRIFYLGEVAKKKEREKVEEPKNNIPEEKRGYREITKEYMESPDPEEQAVREWLENPYPGLGMDAPKEGVADAPYVITDQQFVNEKRNYDKITLYYYDGNGVLVDQTESIQQDIDELIGRESLNHFDETEKGALFVRNENFGTDFEVLMVHESYRPPYPTEDDIY